MKPLSWAYERRYWAQGLRLIGIDEVGRGALAGPLVAAAVMIPSKYSRRFRGLQDSKLLPPVQRERLSAEIQKYLSVRNTRE